jgi:hypothetical protein
MSRPPDASILALDLGLSTGWALRHDGRIESGVQLFDLKRGESPGMRFVRFNAWLQAIGSCLQDAAAEGRLGLVAYEQPHHVGGHATQALLGYATRVEEYAARWQLQHCAVHSNTLKKWTTGSGRAGKVEMFEAAHRRGWLPPGFLAARDLGDGLDDEVDALALLHYVESEIVGHGT